MLETLPTQGLNPEEERKARKLRVDHATASMLAGYHQDVLADHRRKHGDDLKHVGTPEEIAITNQRSDLNSKISHNRDAYDANLWRAEQHKNEHLPEYIETARQEAEAQGVPIGLGEPKE